MARPNCETPDSAALGITRYACASTVMPTNIPTAITAIAMRVAAAFFASGGRKAGTPFDTASTPVIAVQPFANAVSSRNVVSVWCPAATGGGTSTGVMPPLKYSYMPPAINTATLTTNTYVGTAKMRPDSRIPRRFPMARMARNPRHIPTR